MDDSQPVGSKFSGIYTYKILTRVGLSSHRLSVASPNDFTRAWPRALIEERAGRRRRGDTGRRARTTAPQPVVIPLGLQSLHPAGFAALE